ncbi:MAG: hydroxyacylglutathione hydrolase [Steroidobacteraceae bacterium]
MLVERLWAANELRNYQYLIGCAATGEALAIDPLDGAACLAAAAARGWRITQILNTHEHRDHTAGNAAVVAATGARVMAHVRAAAHIGGVDQGLEDGAVIRVGRSVELECLDTPGHTFAHLCLLAHGERLALFSGDTLFNAGVGHCRGGDANLLYDTCQRLLARLPADTRIHPGHDYLLRNLAFTRHVEPENAAARAWQQRFASERAEDMPILTLNEELAVNSFFRLDAPTLRTGLAQRAPQLRRGASAREVFLALRELRNHW